MEFERDFDSVVSQEPSRGNHLRTIQRKLNQPKYLAGFFLLMNKNTEKFTNALKVLLGAFLSRENKFGFIKYIMERGMKLTENSRRKLAKAVFSTDEFVETFTMFNLHFMDNARDEQYNGPFKGLFPINAWSNYHSALEIVEPLLQKKNIHEQLLKYLSNMARKNEAFVEGDAHRCFYECSGEDYNMFMLSVLNKLDGLIDETHRELYVNTVCEALNSLFLPKIRIINIIQKQIAVQTDKKTLSSLKMSVDRMKKILDDSISHNLLLKYIYNVADNIDSDFAIENMCMFLHHMLNDMRYISQGYGDKNNNFRFEKVANSLMEMMVDNSDDMNIDTVKYYLEFLERVKVGDMIPEDCKKFLNLVKNLRKCDKAVFQKSQLRGILKIVEHVNMTRDIYDMCVDALTRNKGKDIVMLRQFADLTNSYLDKLSNDAKQEILCSYTDVFIHIYQTSHALQTHLAEMINKCELSKFSINILKTKLHGFTELHKNLEKAISYKEQTKNMVYDQILKEKKIVNPIFVKLDDKELVIDKTTLESEELKKLIEGKLTVEDVLRYNKLPVVINKKMNMLTFLNIHRSKSE